MTPGVLSVGRPLGCGLGAGLRASENKPGEGLLGPLSRRTGAFLSVIQTRSLCFKERERWRRDAPQTRWFSFSGFEG